MNSSFTLWDLIAATAMALVVACLWLPALADSSQAQPQFTCPGNLRQLQQAVIAYTQDHQGLLPSTVTIPDKSEEKKRWVFWFDHVKSYVTDPRAFSCPDSEKARELAIFRPREPLEPPAVFDAKFVTFGMNAFFSPRYHPTRQPVALESLKDPQNTVLLMDALLPLVRPHLTPQKEIDPHHEGRVNLVSVGGQVGQAKPRFLEKPNPQRLTVEFEDQPQWVWR